MIGTKNVGKIFYNETATFTVQCQISVDCQFKQNDCDKCL